MRRLGRRAYIGATLITVVAVILAAYYWSDFAPFQKFLTKLAAAVLVPGGIYILFAPRILGAEKTRRLGINLAVTGLIIAASLAAAEAATRYIYRDVTTTNLACGYFNDRWKQNHPPKLNQWRFRDRDFSLAPQDGVYRIAVVGDSLTYGKGMLENERMTQVLERRLNEPGGGFEVLNFGRSGAETVDHIGFLQTVVLDSAPDFILLQWFVNDVEGRDKSGRPTEYNLFPSNILHSLLLGNSAVYCVAQNAWNQVLGYFGVTDSYLAYMEARFTDSESPGSKAYATALATLIELTRTRGIPMGIMLYPGPSFLRLGQGPYRLAFLHDRVLDACSRYGITCLDLRATLAAVEDWRSLELNVFDAHPSARSNQIMADAVLARFGDMWSVAAGGN